MRLGPRLLGAGKASAVPQQELRESMPGSEQVGSNVFAASQQIAGRLFRLSRHMDRRERAGAIEDGEVVGVAAIRLNAITRPTRDQRGGDDVAGHVMGRQPPVQGKTARARLVATADWTTLAHAIDKPADRGA